MVRRKRRKTRTTKKKNRRSTTCHAVAVVYTGGKKAVTVSARGKTKKSAIQRVVMKAIKYGAVASVGVYVKGKSEPVYYKDYPAIRKLRIR